MLLGGRVLPVATGPRAICTVLHILLGGDVVEALRLKGIPAISRNQQGPWKGFVVRKSPCPFALDKGVSTHKIPILLVFSLSRAIAIYIFN